jgi:hypothetical protein
MTEMKERWCHFSVYGPYWWSAEEKRVHYFSLCGTWTDSASTRGCADIPLPLLKFSACSSRSSLATSHLMLSISFRQWPSYWTPFFIFQYSRPRVREPTFHPSACMTNVWACNLYDELALRGVTYGRNSCMMKQESWFLPKLYNENFLSDDHCVTHKSWVQDASRRVCPNANNDNTYNLRTSSIHYMNMGRFFYLVLKGSHICPVTIFVKTIYGRCEKWLRYAYPPLPSRHSDLSWVFHTSEPWPIVIGQIVNSPPNLKACVCFQK